MLSAERPYGARAGERDLASSCVAVELEESHSRAFSPN